MALLMDLCPVDYLSGFTSRSSVDGIFANAMNIVHKGKGLQQLQQVLTWKRPTSADTVAASDASFKSLEIEDKKLAALLYGLYKAVGDHGKIPFFGT